MIAMILATGEGAHLSPLTLFMPKPMVPVANKPAMEHSIDLLARNEITNIVASLSAMPDQIENYFGSGQRWGVNLSYSLEKTPLGPAGALKRVEDIFDDTLVVLMGDAITDLDLKAMLSFHRKKKAMVTIAIQPAGQPSASSAMLQLDAENRILQLQESDQTDTEDVLLSSIGVYILEPSILEHIPANTHYDFIHQLFPQLIKNGIPCYGFVSDCYWNDLSSFSKYRAAQTTILTGQIKNVLMPALQIEPGIWKGRNVTIHPSARLLPPLQIGDNTQIGANAEIGPHTVIGSSVIVEEDATVAGSVVLEGTYVGKLVNVQDSVVNRNCLINVPSNTSIFVSDHFLLGEVSQGAATHSLEQALGWLVALATLILSLPLWLVTAVVALFAGGGALIQKELRATNHPQLNWESGTIGWRAIPVYRFRASPTTPTGRWLRRTNLRDLPGLISVLKGDIALVGTGPLTQAQAEDLAEDWHRQRFLAPAGLSGLWYLNGCQYADGQIPFEEQLIADSYYAATRTLKEDIRIFFQTPAAWIRRLFL